MTPPFATFFSIYQSVKQKRQIFILKFSILALRGSGESRVLFKDGCVPNQSPCPTPRRALPSRKITPAFVSSILLLGIRSRKNAPLEGVPSAADAAVFGKISHAKLSLIIFHPGHSYLVKPVMTSVTDAVTGSPQLSIWIPTAGDGSG